MTASTTDATVQEGAAGSGALDLAIRANEAGICVLPPKQDGSKRPDAVSWTKYQTQRTTEEQIRSAYRGSRTGLGYVCGAISGGLELFDFDERSAYDEFKARASDAGLAKLVARIESGYRENTPNGVHLFYRCTETECKKLAQRHNEDGTVKALIETKGTGGYAVVAPSNGLVHPTGEPYILLSGGPESIVTITPAEREELHRVARSLDRLPQPQGQSHPSPRGASGGGNVRPGDDFNARASWGEVLEGWTRVFERDGVSYWRRPGKADGISATVNHGGTDRLACFSTSTKFDVVTESKTTYDKFGAFAVLHHEGDLAASARDLAANGYGQEPEKQGALVASVASVAMEHSAPSWPDPLGEGAYHGLAGEFVHLIEPHTEADPAALLFQFLAQFGNVIGRNAHFLAEADQHFLNLFVVLVGQTAKGRKGTSQGQVQARFKCVDETWAADRVMSGLSSGEGLIWQVRDPIEKKEPIKQKGLITGYQDVIVDEGIQDKRLLIIEPEFASTLRVIGRDGNTLSAVIRQMWDSGNLRTLTKNSPAKATGAHGSIVGHITRDELRRYLDSTEAGNGFANRFLWVCVRRSKVLPEGGRLGEVNFAPFIQRLNDAVTFAKNGGRVETGRKGPIALVRCVRGAIGRPSRPC